MRAVQRSSSLAIGLKTFAAVVAATSLASVSHAAVVYDTTLVDPPGFYNGSGNPNAGFTVNTTSAGIELGLGVNLRFIGPVHPTATNIYNVPLGFSSGSASKWNFEYSVNLQAAPGNAGLHLSDITANISVLNVANGQILSYDPFVWNNDSAGWNGSKNNAGTNTTTDYGFQNSENLGFLFVSLVNSSFGFDPNSNDTYVVTLSLHSVTGLDLGSVNEVIVAGSGAPVPAALPLFASGLGVLGFVARRRKKKSA